MTTKKDPNTDKTLEVIKRGASEIISEGELSLKLSVGRPLRIKFGVDPTSPDIHLGHTVALNKLRAFQELGHKVIFIIGDFTAKIGDPSGRAETRPMLDEKDILANSATYVEQVFKVLDGDNTEVVYNSHWLYPLGIDGILKLARSATVAQMLHRADFAERFKKGADITMLEFLYPLLQGYDSVAVAADVEIGGTDQKFNLLVGRDLQKNAGQEPQVVITMPILEGLDGVKKMSKSYGNHVALNDAPRDMFGKIMSISDEMMLRWYELLTSEYLAAGAGEEHPRDAKARLAGIIVGRYHGDVAAAAAREEFDKIFKRGGLPDDIAEYAVSPSEGKLVSELLVESSMAPSKSEARRLITQGAVRLAGEKINKDEAVPLGADFILQAGKKNFKKIVILKKESK
ncbi:MAG: tyrosine--tRNA ligase [Endomicrobiia bacterium]|nr:tyrosine--tRNA ligase [Endomicrobiia bacterium]